jgi:arsenate reductase
LVFPIIFYEWNEGNFVNVLFLYAGNSCPSILGETTFNHFAHAGWMAMRAGRKPTGEVHLRSIALLKREGIEVDGYFSKSWDNFPATPDIVITVCAGADGEICPAYLRSALGTHWSLEDPAQATGTEEEIRHAFARIYRKIKTRIDIFLSLPINKLGKLALQSALDKIGALHV